jgi:5'(3')-deoxyribonucleotidase
MKQKLFLDFDSTITDSITAFTKVYTQRYKNTEGFIEPNPSLLKQWNFNDICPLLQLNEVGDIFSSKDFFVHLKPFTNAINVLEKHKDNYEMYIVTIGSLKNLSHKANYIAEHFHMIHNTILLNNQGGVMNKSIVNMKGTDELPSIFIDDHGSCIESSNANIKLIYGKTYDWNKDTEGIRCSDWLEVDRWLDYYLTE